MNIQIRDLSLPNALSYGLVDRYDLIDCLSAFVPGVIAFSASGLSIERDALAVFILSLAGRAQKSD